MYNASMPFKWNATRVTPIPTPGTMTNLNNPQARNGGGAQRGFGEQRRSGGGGEQRSGGMNNMRDNRPRDRVRQNDSRPLDKSQFAPPKGLSASRERSARKRSRTRSRSKSPPRRRARHAPRYSVSVPKVCLRFLESNVMDLKKRYSNIYIPSGAFLLF